MIIQHAADGRDRAETEMKYFMVENIHNLIGLQYQKDAYPEALNA